MWTFWFWLGVSPGVTRQDVAFAGWECNANWRRGRRFPPWWMASGVEMEADRAVDVVEVYGGGQVPVKRIAP